MGAPNTQALTVDYLVTGTLDGTTAAPVVDRSAPGSTPFDKDAQIYEPESVAELGVIDPDLGFGGSIGPRCVGQLLVDLRGEVGAPGARVYVAAQKDDEYIELQPVLDLAGVSTAVAAVPFVVPQGGVLVLEGASAGAEPILIRLSVQTPNDPCQLLATLAVAAAAVSPVVDPAAALRNVGFVNPDTGDDATAAIGTTRAFKTLQAFIDAVPQGTDSVSARNVYVAQISPADYDEDLAIDISRRRIVLTSFGPWGLGKFDDPNWGPSSPRRNIIVTGSDPNIDGIRPGLAIASGLPLSECMTTHESYLTRPRISGKLDFSGAAGIGSIELALNCEVFGDAGVAIDAGAAILQSYMYHSRMRGTLTGVNWQFQVAERTRFDGLINVDNYSLFQSCRINAGMTIASTGFAGIRPNGILLTTFAGTYTGAAGTFNCDSYSNWWQKTNNPGGVTVAQKTIQGDLVA